jgi:hypothetical protein
MPSLGRSDGPGLWYKLSQVAGEESIEAVKEQVIEIVELAVGGNWAPWEWMPLVEKFLG